jgi:hypothetical protein
VAPPSIERGAPQAAPARPEREQRPVPEAAVPRIERQPRVAPRVDVQPAVPRNSMVRPRIESPRVIVRPRAFYHPYYTFRPRVRLGFGLWVGYPVVYPYGYPYYYDPYYPPYDYSASPGSVYVAPANVGGLSFDISPSWAEVYVDGQYVGTAGDFGPSYQPLSLTSGRHYVDIRATGYEPMVFDIEVVAGQVLPYRGAMRPE